MRPVPGDRAVGVRIGGAAGRPDDQVRRPGVARPTKDVQRPGRGRGGVKPAHSRNGRQVRADVERPVPVDRELLRAGAGLGRTGQRPPPPTVKLKSLSNWATSFGLACRFLRVTRIDPADVVRSASAFTGPPPVMAPVGVMKANIPALAGAG